MSDSVEPTDTNNNQKLPIEFSFENQALRTVIDDEEPWFVAKDVCDILGLKNSSQAIARLDEDEKGLIFIETHGGLQNAAAVNEPGLYRLIFRSSKPAARRFSKKVTSEILPQIRKTGKYDPESDALLKKYQFVGPNRNDEAITRTLNVLLVSDEIRQKTQDLLENIGRIETIAPAAEQNALTFTKSSLNDQEISIQCPKCRQRLQDRHIISDQMFETARYLAIKAQELIIEFNRERATVEALQAALAHGDEEERGFFDAVAVDRVAVDGQTFKAPAKDWRRPL
ncbi:Bro-N domain-containing protein [uncultured Rhodoblastus sp.]|uniref:BRO-N domain-containing protein n=1 Tax=uncultured Rhodoblastus sp. TaxID=543037 RepID=UPI0025EDDAF2|nr:Bro-N domain-containing protein [uncultured Rhodoblastus sp.]